VGFEPTIPSLAGVTVFELSISTWKTRISSAIIHFAMATTTVASIALGSISPLAWPTPRLFRISYRTIDIRGI